MIIDITTTQQVWRPRIGKADILKGVVCDCQRCGLVRMIQRHLPDRGVAVEVSVERALTRIGAVKIITTQPMIDFLDEYDLLGMVGCQPDEYDPKTIAFVNKWGSRWFVLRRVS